MKKCSSGCIFALITAGSMPGCMVTNGDTGASHDRQFSIGLECRGPCDIDISSQRTQSENETKQQVEVTP